MAKMNPFLSLEVELLKLQEAAKQRPLTIGEMLQILSSKGCFFSLIILSLPFCQPIQIPGVSSPFGLAIAFIGLRITYGKRLWLPKTLLNKQISTHTIETMTSKALTLFKKIQPWIHPRYAWMCHSPFMEKGNGLMIVTLGMLLALPLPIPLSNLAAAWSILFISVGMIGNDGLLVLIGYLIFLLSILFFILIAFILSNNLFD